MNRRIALKNLAFVAAGLLVLPGCDGLGWNKASVQAAEPLLGAGQEKLLAELVESIIPATDTPGAKALGVHEYIHKILADCREKEVQALFVQELGKVEALSAKEVGKSFTAAGAAERARVLALLEAAEDEDQQAFYASLKALTIKGYLSAEYVMTNLTKYEMVPGRYLGCVPVSSKIIS